MNTIALSITTLPEARPLEFVEAAALAGYGGCGFHLHKSPAYPTWENLVEWPAPKGSLCTPPGWATLALKASRRCLANCYAGRG